MRGHGKDRDPPSLKRKARQPSLAAGTRHSIKCIPRHTTLLCAVSCAVRVVSLDDCRYTLAGAAAAPNPTGGGSSGGAAAYGDDPELAAAIAASLGQSAPLPQSGGVGAVKGGSMVGGHEDAVRPLTAFSAA
eukprot:SAG11_NODE_2721_length_3044_cov_10.912733_4_plen_132_part_00